MIQNDTTYYVIVEPSLASVNASDKTTIKKNPMKYY